MPAISHYSVPSTGLFVGPGFAGNAANPTVFAAVLTRKLMIDIIRMTL